jgi:hypothetical protein
MQVRNNHLTSWPVFRGDGDVEYLLPGIAEVPGAVFSADGDTLYAVVARRDPTNDSLRWSADIFETASGGLLASLEFPEEFPHDLELTDIALDPELDRAYAAYCSAGDRGIYERCGMAVIDRRSWSLIAAVPAGERRYFDPYFGGFVQFDRTTLQLYVVNFWTGNETVTVHTYDTR